MNKFISSVFMIFGAFENGTRLFFILLFLFPTATEKVAYVIRINFSDPRSVSPNPGHRHIKIE